MAVSKLKLSIDPNKTLQSVHGYLNFNSNPDYYITLPNNMGYLNFMITRTVNVLLVTIIGWQTQGTWHTLTPDTLHGGNPFTTIEYKPISNDQLILHFKGSGNAHTGLISFDINLPGEIAFRTTE